MGAALSHAPSRICHQGSSLIHLTTSDLRCKGISLTVFMIQLINCTWTDEKRKFNDLRGLFIGGKVSTHSFK